MAEHMYSADEAAQILGLQVRTVRNYVRDGQLPGVRIGKQYRIARADLEAFTAGSGGRGTAAATVALEPAANARPSAEVSSVVQIDAIGEAAAERLARTLTAAMVAAGPEGSPDLRIEPLYDQARRRLKLIIVGGVGATAEILRIVELFSLDGSD